MQILDWIFMWIWNCTNFLNEFGKILKLFCWYFIFIGVLSTHNYFYWNFINSKLLFMGILSIQNYFLLEFLQLKNILIWLFIFEKKSVKNVYFFLFILFLPMNVSVTPQISPLLHYWSLRQCWIECHMRIIKAIIRIITIFPLFVKQIIKVNICHLWKMWVLFPV